MGMVGHSHYFIAEKHEQFGWFILKSLVQKGIVQPVISRFNKCIIFIIPLNLLKKLIVHHLLLIHLSSF